MYVIHNLKKRNKKGSWKVVESLEKINLHTKKKIIITSKCLDKYSDKSIYLENL